MSTADHDLLKQWVQHNNAEAFRAVALRYAGMVFGTCRRILQNSSDAEDAAQETFAKLAAIKKADVNVGPWLHRVAVNSALVHLRGERRRHRREEAYVRAGVAASGSTDEAISSDVMARLDEAVAALPDKLREPLVLHFYACETHEAIAEKLHVSRQTVGYRIEKGIAGVRAEMSDRLRD